MRWRELRDDAVAQLRDAGVGDPAQEVRWIVEQASGLTPAAQAGALDEPVDDRHLLGMERMVSRRAAGEPLQHVLGRWGFRTLDLLVDRRVLIPRPETEVVAGLALAELAALDRPGLAVDLGTGSGAIALSLAAEMWPRVEVWGTDTSADALAVARANLAGLGRRGAVVRLVEGDWFAALPDDLRGRIDVVVSNPPYVAEHDPIPDDVARWEPRTALVPGPTGLEAIERIVAESPGWLAPGGSLVLEIGESQGDVVTVLARSSGFTHVAIHPDLAGRDRALVARHPGPRAPTDAAYARLMGPPVVAIDDDLAAAVDRSAAVLRGGGVVVLPTDTVYGIAALPGDERATMRLFELKGRGTGTPLAVLCADADQAIGLAEPGCRPALRAVGERCWPGPLTMVVPRLAGVELHLGEPSTTIGLRVPDHDLVRALAAAVGPIAATSANRHGLPTAVTAVAAAASLEGDADLVVDGGPIGGSASTVVDATSSPWRVLRAGPLRSDEVLALERG